MSVQSEVPACVRRIAIDLQERQRDQTISIAYEEIQILVHTGNVGIGDVLSVHERDAVHETQRWDQTPVYDTVDLLPLLWREELLALRVAAIFDLDISAILMLVCEPSLRGDGLRRRLNRVS